MKEIIIRFDETMVRDIQLVAQMIEEFKNWFGSVEVEFKK